MFNQPQIYSNYWYELESIFLHSISENKVGDSGAYALADALSVNQSLKALK